MLQRLKARILDRPRGEALAYLGLMAIALVLRVIDLGDRPFHHDESQDAYFSWILHTDHRYEYMPILHGPLRFYMTAGIFGLFGDSNFTARLAPVLMGTLIVGLPYLLRKQIGRGAALSVAVLLAIGPTYLYFSRFAREDIYIAAINLALIVAIFRYLDRPWRGGPAVIGGLLALAFATKESTFITVAIIGGFFIFHFLWERRGLPAIIVAAVAIAVVAKFATLALIGALALLFVAWLLLELVLMDDVRQSPVIKAVTSVGWVPWAYGLAVFWLVFTLLFTVALTKPDGLWAGIYEGLDYWIGQQDVGRGGEPWYFHIVLLVANEWPLLLLGIVGAVACLRRRTLLDLFLVFFFVASLAAYSKASEKFAWLVMHPLMPLIVLAGIGAQFLWTHRSRAVRAVGIAGAAVALAYAGYASYLANAEHRADPREFLVSTQSSEDIPTVVRRVKNLDARVKRRTGQGVTIDVDNNEGATFPWAWYFRGMRAGYPDMRQSGYVPQAQVLLMTETTRSQLLPNLAAYEGRQFRFRVWWVRDWKKKFDAGAWLDWYAEREVWNPVGGMPEWIYVRRDAQVA